MGTDHIGAYFIRKNRQMLNFQGHTDTKGQIHFFPRPDYAVEEQKIVDANKPELATNEQNSISFPMEVSMSSK